MTKLLKNALLSLFAVSALESCSEKAPPLGGVKQVHPTQPGNPANGTNPGQQPAGSTADTLYYGIAAMDAAFDSDTQGHRMLFTDFSNGQKTHYSFDAQVSGGPVLDSVDYRVSYIGQKELLAAGATADLRTSMHNNFKAPGHAMFLAENLKTHDSIVILPVATSGLSFAHTFNSTMDNARAAQFANNVVGGIDRMPRRLTLTHMP